MDKISTKECVSFGDLNFAIGSVDKKNPSTFYVETSFWVKMGKNCDDINKSIRRINKSVKKLLSGLVNDYCFNNNFIFDIDTSIDGLLSGKTNSMTMSFDFCQFKYKTFEDVVNVSKNIIETYYSKIFSILSDNGIICYSSKRND